MNPIKTIKKDLYIKQLELFLEKIIGSNVVMRYEYSHSSDMDEETFYTSITLAIIRDEEQRIFLPTLNDEIFEFWVEKNK